MRKDKTTKQFNITKYFFIEFLRRNTHLSRVVITCSSLSFCFMRKCVLLCFYLLIFFSSKAQWLDSALSSHALNATPEKAFLHFDKSAYVPGETIWFKAYVMEDIFPAAASKTLYTDFIGSDGEVIHHSVSPLVDGITNGQFDLPTTYKGDYVHIRSYTRWMLNFDTAFLFSKYLHIINDKPAARTKSSPLTSLQLFPEGGEIVAGVTNRIAFKATDQWGRPAKISGVVMSDKEPFIDSLRIIHDGMGSFYLLPSASAVYSVRWKDGNGAEKTVKLPPVREQGITMQVTQNRSRRIIAIHSSPQLPGQLKQLRLVGTMNGNKAFETAITVTEGNTVQRLIPTEALPSGILTLTVFDAAWNAVAERITFINNHEYAFYPSMEVRHWGLGTRKRNEIEILLPDSLQDASLSISVTDLALESDTSENIISQFLLSSDIKGKVYNPAYYFSGKDEVRAHHLDYVMLTNGWRRFKWEDLAKGIVPKIRYPRDTAYLSLSGQVFGLSKSTLSGNESIVLFVKDKDSAAKMAIMELDRQGRFVDPSYVFFDTLNVYYSLKSKRFAGGEARFMVDRLPTPDYSKFSKGLPPGFRLTDTTGSGYHSGLVAEKNRLEHLTKGKVMETIIVKTAMKSPIQVLEERYTSGLFRGGDGYQFDLMNDPHTAAYRDIFNFLQGRVAGLQVTTGGEPTLTWRGGTPQLFLDEIQTDATMISTIPVSHIAYIKIFRPPFYGGFNGGSGAIAVYTKKGEDSRGTSGGLSSHTLYGYTPLREFYSPNYDRFEKRHEEKDYRSTLYWNPMIETSAGQKTVKLKFYNNDVTKAFRIVVQGFTKNGLLTHFVQVME